MPPAGRGGVVSGFFAAAAMEVGSCARLYCQQAPPDHEKIDEGAGGEQPVGVFVDPPVADLGEAEYALHHAETVFGTGADLGLERS